MLDTCQKFAVAKVYSFSLLLGGCKGVADILDAIYDPVEAYGVLFCWFYRQKKKGKKKEYNFKK